MSNNIVLKAEDLEGYLTDDDIKNIDTIENHFKEALVSFKKISKGESNHSMMAKEREKIISIYDKMGKEMQSMLKDESRIHVYPFENISGNNGEVSRLIAKLRDIKTGHDEFVYYIQRAFELLFPLAWPGVPNGRNHLVVKTPVTMPEQNYAVHRIPDIDDEIEDTVMCVMLRGALLPSMILSKEIQEYSSTRDVTPFALFRIKRDDSKMKDDMEYILDLNKSYFDLKNLHGKNLVFADPMNATGGSLVTIVNYLKSEGIKPKSIKLINVIASLKGALQVARSISDIDIYTLWLDPVLNDAAYILPGLGDAGDRLNGVDLPENPRNMIQLIADYGSNISNLYRDQVRKIEETILV